MPVYYYDALDASGAEAADRVEAADALEAIERIRARGLSVRRLQLGGSAPGRRRLLPRLLWIVWSSLFLACGGLFLYFLGVRPVWGVLRSPGWPATPCTVVSSALNEQNSEDGPSYRIEIVYRYQFGAATYESDGYDFIGLSSNTNVAEKRSIVRGHPPGSQTVCYVNPANPAEAVLQRGWTNDMWWGLFPIPFVAAGACGMVFGAFGVRFRRKPSADKDEARPGGIA